MSGPFVVENDSSYFSYQNLYHHYISCRKNKRNTYNALRFEAHQEKQLLNLCETLSNRSYKPKPSVCFINKQPKLREIFAADFRDRVVHHVLIDYLETIWEPIFIHDSYACRRGKGVHQGVKRLQQFIHKITLNGQRRAWYLQLDIKNYFMRIDKSILWQQLAPKINHADMFWLTELLVFHDCTENYIFRGNPSELKNIPKHKSLLTSPANKGLPIGNLNSQFFANVYLNALDQFVKHQLKCNYYLRYCDDFILLANSSKQLQQWQQQISNFLQQTLLLELNPSRERLKPVSDGIDFLGYIVRRKYMLVRKRVINHLQIKLQAFEKELVSVENSVIYYRYNEERLNSLHATLSSYLGHFKMASTYKLWQSIWNRFAFLKQYFYYNEKTKKLQRKYLVPKQLNTVRQQYHFFRCLFPDDVLFFQVGKYFEFYHKLQEPVLKLLNLVPIQKSSRGLFYGFPMTLQQDKISLLLKADFSVIIIAQLGNYISRIKQRLPLVRSVRLRLS
ncbi:MAG: reverse transcriptase domain-containing protein [Methylococcales bacterium]